MGLPTLQTLCATSLLKRWSTDPQEIPQDLTPMDFQTVSVNFSRSAVNKEKLTDEFFEKFTHLQWETSVYLRDWKITNLSLYKLLPRGHALTQLNIAGTQCASGAFRDVVENFPHLKHFGCSLEFLSEEDRLSSLTQLKSVEVFISKKQIRPNFFEGVSLTTFFLKIEKGAELDADFEVNLIKALQNTPLLAYLSLEKLELQGLEFKALLKACSNLETLQLAGGRLASPVSLDYVREYAKQIRHVILDGRKIVLPKPGEEEQEEELDFKTKSWHPASATDFFDLTLCYPTSEDEEEDWGNGLTQDGVTLEFRTSSRSLR